MILLILAILACGWLLWGIIRVSFTVAWGAVKIIAWILSILALPLLLILALTAGGFLLLLPVALLAAAFGLIQSV